MGNQFSSQDFRYQQTRVRQARVCLQLGLLILFLYKFRLHSRNSAAPATSAAVSPTDESLPHCDSSTSCSSFPPTPTSTTTVYVAPPRFAWFHRWLTGWNAVFSRYEPWQVIVGTLTVVHLLNNLSVLLGLEAPVFSVRKEPDMHYSASFSRARTLLTAMDAGFLSTYKVKFVWLRNILSIILSIYYLIFVTKAEQKVTAFRAAITPDHLRMCWEKGSHPLLKTFDRLKRAPLTIEEEKVSIARDDGSLIHCSLWYPGTREQLKKETRLILDFPGGGFVAMAPTHHADYLSVVARRLQCPLLAVDYRKAPEHPYPAGFDDCWSVYESVISSQGGVLGMNSEKAPLRLALYGDSAGGNLVCGVTVKAIQNRLQVADGIHLIYPVLDFVGTIWNHQTQRVDNFEAQKLLDEPVASSSATADSTSTPIVPTPRPSFSAPSQLPRSLSVAATLVDATSLPALLSVDADSADVTSMRKRSTPLSNPHPRMSTRMTYAYDGVLPLKYMFMLGDAYFKNGGDPVNDPFISPIVADMQTLAKFPSTYIHVGSVDPLLDDSLRFVEKLKCANPSITTKLHIFHKISHAYMQITSILKEGKEALDLSVQWLGEILDDANSKIDVNTRSSTGIPVSPTETILANSPTQIHSRL